MEKIIIKIDKESGIEYEVQGVKGGKCKDLTKIIDKIAGKVVSSKVTGEFCQVDTQAKQNVGGA